MRRIAAVLGAGWMMGLSAAAVLESPEQLVRAIYFDFGKPALEAHYWLEKLMAPEARHAFFTPEIIRVLEINYAHELGPAYSCLEVAQAVSGHDYDEIEIQNTLRLDSRDEGERRLVDARFSSLGWPHHLRYEFVLTADGWRIADILSLWEQGTHWRLSELSSCE
ncbi:hypothetical protein ACU6RQ_15930 [Zobellella denitrificans]